MNHCYTFCNKIVKNKSCFVILAGYAFTSIFYYTVQQPMRLEQKIFFYGNLDTLNTEIIYIYLRYFTFSHFTEGIRFHPYSSTMAPEVCLELSHHTISLSAAFLNNHKLSEMWNICISSKITKHSFQESEKWLKIRNLYEYDN